MAGMASALLALILLLPCASASAGDLFTGFQLDGEAEYFTYLGAKENLPWEALGVKTYVQLFAAAQSYTYDSGSREIEADLQTLTPSLGLTKALGDGAWTVSALVGPNLRWKKESGSASGSTRDFDVGAFVQLESMYWQETHSFHGILSYASLDSSFFGRIRGTGRIYEPEAGCCSIFAGMDVAAAGNDDFNSVQTGPVIEVPVGRS